MRGLLWSVFIVLLGCAGSKNCNVLPEDGAPILTTFQFDGRLSVSLPATGDTLQTSSFRNETPLYGMSVFRNCMGGDIGHIPYSEVLVLRLEIPPPESTSLHFKSVTSKVMFDAPPSKIRLARVEFKGERLAFEIRVSSDPPLNPVLEKRMAADDSLFSEIFRSITFLNPE